MRLPPSTFFLQRSQSVPHDLCDGNVKPSRPLFPFMDTPRSSLKTPRSGLDRALLLMRLFEKAKRPGTWDPQETGFSQDRADWQGLSDRERDLLLRLTAQFQNGEEIGRLRPAPDARRHGRRETHRRRDVFDLLPTPM